MKQANCGNCGDCRHSWRSSNAGGLLCDVYAEMIEWELETAPGEFETGDSLEEIPCMMPHWERGADTCGDYESVIK